MMTEVPLFDAVSEDVREVFDYWVDTMNKRSNTLLDNKRQVRITWALSVYDKATVKQAIKGCTYSSFHMGQNASGKRYNDLELILRDAPHIESFLDLYEQHTAADDELEEWLND